MNISTMTSSSAASLTQHQRLREAVMLTFYDPPPEATLMLQELSKGQWKRLLYWLDISGLALYFLDRITQLGRFDWLPTKVQSRLAHNLADNALRTAAMLAECVTIDGEFQRFGLSHLLLKGFSLAPSSVPRSDLRSQLDLDFLIAADHAGHARSILEGRGYVLHAISGRSWEFKTPDMPPGSLRDLYKDSPSRCVELHLEAEPGEPGPRIVNAEHRVLGGFEMAVLAPADLLVGQAVHLYKHVSTGSFRCSHLLEFYRHVVSRRDDKRFWEQVNERLMNNERAYFALGFVTLLTECIMGRFAPDELAVYVGELSQPVRLWIEVYGPRCVYASFPGNKLYLLLQTELAQGDAVKQSFIGRSLLPRRLPPAISHALPNEHVSMRVKRSWRQFSYVLFRLRFHLVEGLRYAWEQRRWKRLMQHDLHVERESQPGQAAHLSRENKGMTIL